MQNKNKIKVYAISLLISLGTGGLSAFLTRENMNIYDEIITPPLSPPSIVFPIIWTILFILMGISAGMIYLNKDKSMSEAGEGLRVYVFQLIMNFFWSIIFFNMRAFTFAFIWIVILWIAIITMILKFRKVNKTAAYLQIPYAIWVLFAAYLNIMIAVLN